MTKIVISKSFGGCTLPDSILKFLEDRGLIFDKHIKSLDCLGIERTDPNLVEAVETCKFDEYLYRLMVIEIPDDVKWHIADYDGMEWVAEDHREWGR